MNIFDSLIGYFAPATGLQRSRARAAGNALTRSYEGSRVGRRTDGWITANTDGNAEIAPAMKRLRARSHDLVRNNAYAAKAVTALAANLIGTGIIPRARANDPELADAADALWVKFVLECDASGRTDFYGLQTLIARTVVESGECLVRIRRRQAGDGLAVPLQFQVLEPDYLDVGRDGELGGGGYVANGIEYDVIERRVAYWMFPRHPGGALFRAPASVRVPAADVLHIHTTLRPGQNRGVPWFAPAIIRMRDLDEYEEAELVRKKIESCYAAFVIGAEDGDHVGDLDDDDDRIEKFKPGMVAYLPPGKDVRFGEPKSSGGYGEFNRSQLHAVASAVGLTYELLTGDLSQVNYSSIRAGLIEFRRHIEQLQWQVFVHNLCRPVWTRFIDTAQASGALPAGEIEAEWTPPRFEAVDPLKDVQADILAVRAGFMTLKEAIARQGYDPTAVLTEIAATNETLDELNIVLDTDPRRSTRTGLDKPLPSTQAELDAAALAEQATA